MSPHPPPPSAFALLPTRSPGTPTLIPSVLGAEDDSSDCGENDNKDGEEEEEEEEEEEKPAKSATTASDSSEDEDSDTSSPAPVPADDVNAGVGAIDFFPSSRVDLDSAESDSADIDRRRGAFDDNDGVGGPASEEEGAKVSVATTFPIPADPIPTRTPSWLGIGGGSGSGDGIGDSGEDDDDGLAGDDDDEEEEETGRSERERAENDRRDAAREARRDELDGLSELGVPVMREAEVRTGAVLGGGAFCQALEVEKVELVDLFEEGGDGMGHVSFDEDPRSNFLRFAAKTPPLKQPKTQADLRKRLHHQYVNRRPPAKDRPGRARGRRRRPPPEDPSEKPPLQLALKCPRPDLKDEEQYRAGMKDLHTEVGILLRLARPGHGNVVGLHGVGLENCDYDRGEEVEDIVIHDNRDHGGSGSGGGDCQDGNVGRRLRIGWRRRKTVPRPSQSSLHRLYLATATFSVIDRSTFVLLDRLHGTLSSRICRWRDSYAVALTRRLRRDSWLERLVVLTKIAGAVRYLHSRGVLHRDLKPEHVGFDAEGAPKLFDFAVARVVPMTPSERDSKFDSSFPQFSPSSAPSPLAAEERGGSENEDEECDKAYNLTGETGTPRYMAPEVGLSLPYGPSCDIYSLSILMHEVLTLSNPYPGVPIRSFRQVVYDGGRRPLLDASWPEGMRTLLARMWDGERQRRPRGSAVVNALETMLRGRDNELFPRGRLRRALDKRVGAGGESGSDGSGGGDGGASTATTEVQQESLWGPVTPLITEPVDL